MLNFNFLNDLKNNILNLIFNQNCLICNCSKTDNFLCKNCAKDVENLSFFAQKFYNSIPIFSAYYYSGTIKKLIQLLKFSHKKISANALAGLLFNYFKQTDLKDNYVIVYPPVFFLKSASRGYNHMLLIAKEFSKLTGFEIEKNLIKKIKYTLPQYKTKNRRKNIKGSYKINEKLIENYINKNILLLDDITTSGATIEELLDCLLEKGIKNITVLTIAKTVKK